MSDQCVRARRDKLVVVTYSEFPGEESSKSAVRPFTKDSANAGDGTAHEKDTSDMHRGGACKVRRKKLREQGIGGKLQWTIIREYQYRFT